MVASVAPFSISEIAGNYSTDADDASWIVPLVSMSAGTWPPGTPGHSWQAVAAGGTSMGIKGMKAIDLFENPAIIEKAKLELYKRRGAQFKYEPIIGDRAPALDYAGKH